MEIELFLKSKGFDLVKRDISDSFGDYCDVFTNGNLEFRVGSTKSSFFIDVRVCEKDEIWYDLALFRALLYDVKLLSEKTSIEDYSSFFKTNYFKILELLDKTNYQKTKEKLNELMNERARQLFPKLF